MVRSHYRAIFAGCGTGFVIFHFGISDQALHSIFVLLTAEPSSPSPIGPLIQRIEPISRFWSSARGVALDLKPWQRWRFCFFSPSLPVTPSTTCGLSRPRRQTFCASVNPSFAPLCGESHQLMNSCTITTSHFHRLSHSFVRVHPWLNQSTQWTNVYVYFTTFYSLQTSWSGSQLIMELFLGLFLANTMN